MKDGNVKERKKNFLFQELIHKQQHILSRKFAVVLQHERMLIGKNLITFTFTKRIPLYRMTQIKI